MEHWQQTAYREDPYPEVPFDNGRKWSPETLVGLACLAACLLVLAFGR